MDSSIKYCGGMSQAAILWQVLAENTVLVMEFLCAQRLCLTCLRATGCPLVPLWVKTQEKIHSQISQPRPRMAICMTTQILSNSFFWCFIFFIGRKSLSCPAMYCLICADLWAQIRGFPQATFDASPWQTK